MATSTDLRSAIEEVQGQLPETQLPVEGQLPLSEGDWASKLERRVGALPWWTVSAAAHAVIFLLIALLATAVAPSTSDEVIIATDVVKPKPPEYDPLKKRDIFKNTKEVQAETVVDNPVVTHEKVEETDHFETDNQMDKNTSRGSEDAISDIPLGGTGTVGSIGVGGGGMAGCFGYRDGGGRKKAVGRFGGSEVTESAVEAALRWLARHQEADGHWDAGKKYEGGYSGKWDAGVTGLATLAFLGAGYTHKDRSPFQDNVRRAVAWMIERQKANGGVFFATQKSAANDHWTYDHFICTLAMAEAYGMSKDPWVAEPAQKGVDGVLQCQNNYSGWRYGIKPGDSDMSVSGWAVMALKSAKIAGLHVDGTGFQGAASFIDKITDARNGRIGYTGRGNTNGTSPEPCTAIGMVCRQFMGTPVTDQLLRQQADVVIKKLPDWNRLETDHAQQYYHWYYGTLAMFQMGGAHWDNWNKALKDTLVPHQCRGPLPLSSDVTDKDGSWDPKGWVSNYAGRVYSTALGALTLEVYYRYLPMYAK